MKPMINDLKARADFLAVNTFSDAGDPLAVLDNIVSDGTKAVLDTTVKFLRHKFVGGAHEIATTFNEVTHFAHAFGA